MRRSAQKIADGLHEAIGYAQGANTERERILLLIELIEADWKKSGQSMKVYASQYLRAQIIDTANGSKEGGKA